MAGFLHIGVYNVRKLMCRTRWRSIVQMFNIKNLTLITGLAVSCMSVQAQAAVVFNSYSYYDIGGDVADNFTGDSASYLWSGGVAINDFAGELDSVSLGASGELYAESDAFVDLSDVYVSGSTTSIYGYVESSATAGSTYTDQSSYAYGDAVIDLDFSLDGTYTYDFFSRNMEAWGNANVYYDLYSYDSDSIIFSSFLTNGTDSPWLTGSLSAGSYNLIVEAISDADGVSYAYDIGSAYGDFGLELTAVPVPAAVWLFGSGLIGLAGFARRKAR